MTRPTVTNENKAKLLELMAEEPRLAYWQVAAEMGIHENTFARRMRIPNDEQAAEIRAAIKAIRDKQ